MNDPSHVVERFALGLRRRVRFRRTVAAAATAVAGACIAALVPSVAILAGWPPPWWWTPSDLVGVATTAALLGALGAGLAPLLVRGVALAADRRLGLDGGLITAVDVLGSRDPFCRLVVARTAAFVSGVKIRRVVSIRPPAVLLLLPALVTLAFALSARTPPRHADPDRVAARPADTSVAAFSHDLQQTVAAMISMHEPITAEAMKTAQEILEIDSALREGRLDLEQARSALSELAAASVSESARTEERRAPVSTGRGRGDTTGSGADLAPDHKWLDALRALARGEPARSDPSSGPEPRDAAGSFLVESTFRASTRESALLPGGAGDGAGSGEADLLSTGSGRQETVLNRPARTRVWSLPAPLHRSRTGESVAGQDGPVGQARGVSGESEFAGSRERLLTVPERAIVKSYLDRLRRRQEIDEDGRTQEEGQS